MDGFDDFFGNLFTQNTRLHQRKKRFIQREINSGEMFEKVEETRIDETGGPSTEETLTIYQAGCGHFVGFYGPHELVAKCSHCGKYLCHRCGNVRCRRCLSILCGDNCAKVVNGIEVYCNKCRAVHYLKRFSFFNLKVLHQFLSKEF